MVDLTEYGFNKYENAAYVTLVKIGVSTAHLISKESGVPHGKIYPVLAKLVQKNVVTEFSGAPKRYMAVEPKVVFENFFVEKEREMKTLKNQSSSIVKSLEKLGINKQEPIQSVQIIEGYKNYLNLSAKLHEECQKEWLSISRLPVYQPHMDSYRQCVKRGVKVKILTEVTEKNEAHIPLWKKTGVELRDINVKETRISVIDQKQCIIRFSEGKKYLAIWLQNPALAKGMRDYFMMLWKKGKAL